MSTRPVPAAKVDEGPEPSDGVGETRTGRRRSLAVPTVVPGPDGVVIQRRKGRRAAIYDDQTGKSRKGRAPRVVEVRKVRRVLRRVDTWSVFRFAILLYLCGLVVFMAAVVGVWMLASSAGAIPSIQTFITQLFALKRFRFKPGQLFLGTLGVGAVWVFVATLFTVLTAVLFNLISDVVGGIELTMLEETPVESVEPPAEPAAPGSVRPKR